MIQIIMFLTFVIAKTLTNAEGFVESVQSGATELLMDPNFRFHLQMLFIILIVTLLSLGVN